MSKPKFSVLVPGDVAIKKSIIRWLRDNTDDIDQILVIVTKKSLNGDSICRANMHNMEKVWYMEQHKYALFSRRFYIEPPKPPGA